MNKSELVKEKIIEAAIELIKSSSGEINEITTRSIAKKAEVGLGLVNYHFKSKDNLIEIAVQKIIEGIIKNFKPNIEEKINPIDRLKEVSKEVADFLIENPSVSKISIVGDMMNPRALDNTMKTVKGFMFSLEDVEFSEKEKALLSFILTSVLQNAFLRKEVTENSFGFNFNEKNSRDIFIDFVIDRLFIGRDKYENINN
ncbi:TetR/AcrR family transcriptional regulator [Clostridium felsineum]|uniref:TetR/AcrR family transcriptional regulator n=1 Tax=Clostridium felsineum TaxID=36839 RepID=UPI00214D2442|nr:TetR/AcrR family transcriptional regulator [Clostridium felsineum]MCR3758426.1 TetR/AcrR family transcriptional regulator [Clostridium felsineum]